MKKNNNGLTHSHGDDDDEKKKTDGLTISHPTDEYVKKKNA